MYLQVCELHFHADDIERETSYFDERTGRKLTVKLGKSRLRKGAVPTKLPNCHSYLSTTTILRESLDVRKCRKEEAAIQYAIVESVADELQHRQHRTFETTDELINKLKNQDKYWTIVKEEESVLICHIARMPHPKITLSLTIDNSCAVKVFVSQVEVQKLGDYSIPGFINDINYLEDLLPNLKNVTLKNPLLILAE